jgi:hypothetical protein
MRNKIGIVVVLIALAWGLEQVMVSPLETGAVYPEYSSLRSDPMGSMALYESFSKILKVERLYKSRSQIHAGPETAVFILGVASSKMSAEAFKEYENLTAKGARVVIAFLPDPNTLWAKDLQKWKSIDRQAKAFERPLGGGTIVLVGNSYPLSNEGLREQHDAALLIKLVGPAKEVIFDENHFGVVETGSVTKLMHKYHLEGMLAVLAIVAGLFIWRSSSSLLPSRAPQSGQPVSGRDSLEGMTALLRRGIAEKDLLRVCYKEWSLNGHKSSNIDVHDALFDHKNVVSAYKSLMEKL